MVVWLSVRRIGDFVVSSSVRLELFSGTADAEGKARLVSTERERQCCHRITVMTLPGKDFFCRAGVITTLTLALSIYEMCSSI